MRYFKLFSLILMCLCVIQCANIDLTHRVVQQGNLLPEKKFNKLAIGMSKRQVASLMGTSLLSPMFATNRWDYAFTKRKGGGKIYIKRAELFFSHGELSRINVSKNYE